MCYPKWTENIYKELIFMFLGLFFVLAIAEVNEFHVILRSPSEFFILVFYYLFFYFLILALRILLTMIKKNLAGIFSRYHLNIESNVESSPKERHKRDIQTEGPEIKPPPPHGLSKILKPFYALHHIRSLF